MGKRSQVSDWLKNDEAQRAWAINYLNARGWAYVTQPFTMGHEAGVASMETFARTLAGEKVIRTMRGTWQKSRNNKKGDRPTCSYTLPRSAKRALNQLAQDAGLSMSATLEKLISGEFASEQAAKKKRKADLEAERKARKEQRSSPIRQLLKEQMLTRKIHNLEMEIAKRQELFSAWLLLYVQREVLLGTLPANFRLDDLQLQAVIRQHETLLAYHEDKLRAALEPEQITYGFPDLADIPVVENTSAGNEDHAEVATALNDDPASGDDSSRARDGEVHPPNGDRTETGSTNFDQQRLPPPPESA